VQLRTVTINSIYIYIYIHTYIYIYMYISILLPYSTCPGDCLTRMTFFGCFPISSLLPDSTIIAYLKTRKTASFHVISNTKSKFTIDCTQLRQPRLRHPSTYRNTSGSVTLLVAQVCRCRRPFSFCTLRPVRNLCEQSRYRSEVWVSADAT